jgi:hypothetical protein
MLLPSTDRTLRGREKLKEDLSDEFSSKATISQNISIFLTKFRLQYLDLHDNRHVRMNKRSIKRLMEMILLFM